MLRLKEIFQKSCEQVALLLECGRHSQGDNFAGDSKVTFRALESNIILLRNVRYSLM